MLPLALCAECACHIKTTETSCPFCGAVREAKGPGPAAVAPARMSRAQWLALGSALAALGCSSEATPSSSQQAKLVINDASTGAGASPDAAHEPDPTGAIQAMGAGVLDSGVIDADAATQVAVAKTPCGDGGCDPGSTVCVIQTTTSLPTNAPGNSDGVKSSCMPRPADGSCFLGVCGCLGFSDFDTCDDMADPTGEGMQACGSETCAVDDAGVVRVDDNSVQPCYGAPPARLERLAPSVS